MPEGLLTIIPAKSHEEASSILVNALIESIEHPVAGPIRQARPAARFDKTPIGIQRHAPMLGSDGRSILRELNYGDEEISKLVADGVVVEQK